MRGLDARVPGPGGVVLACLQPLLDEVDHRIPVRRAGFRGPTGGSGATRALPARGCRGLQSQVGLHRPGGPASGGPRRVRGPGLLQPLPRFVDAGEVVAVGLGTGGQAVAVGHEYPVAQLPLESRRYVALGGGHGAADGAVAFRDPQQVGDRVTVLQDGPGPRGQHFLVGAPGWLPWRSEAHGTQLAEGAECHAGDEQQGIGFAGGGGEQPGMTRAAGGVEEPERPLQAHRHLREDVAQRVPRARGAGRRSRGCHGMYRHAAWTEVVHLPARPGARREQQVACCRGGGAQVRQTGRGLVRKRRTR